MKKIGDYLKLVLGKPRKNAPQTGYVVPTIERSYDIYVAGLGCAHDEVREYNKRFGWIKGE